LNQCLVVTVMWFLNKQHQSLSSFAHVRSGWLWKEPVVVAEDVCAVVYLDKVTWWQPRCPRWWRAGPTHQEAADERQSASYGWWRSSAGCNEPVETIWLRFPRRCSRSCSWCSLPCCWFPCLDVHVDSTALPSPVLPLLVSTASNLCFAHCLLHSFRSLRCRLLQHSQSNVEQINGNEPRRNFRL